MALNSTRILLADLQTKYEDIKQNDSNKHFYTKIADYGKYLLDHSEFDEILAPLYEESQQDISKYLTAAKRFLEEWNILAKDLIELAEKAGIKDVPSDQFKQSIRQIKDNLGKTDPSTYSKDIDSYYLPYQLLIGRFFKEGKADLIIPRHNDKDANYPQLQKIYNEATDQWNRFKNQREIKPWWAHYQIERLTCGALDVKKNKGYFSADDSVTFYFRFEFHQVLTNNTSTYVMLDRDKFTTWLNRLHKYITPRLNELIDKGTPQAPTVGIKFENNSLFITMSDGSQKVLDFESQKGTNDMLILFTIMYKHWQKQGQKPLEKKELLIRLERDGIERDKLSTGEFLSSTISNIRKKIKSKQLQNNLSILYDAPTNGYRLQIIAPDI